jgi:hypothetical protein
MSTGFEGIVTEMIEEDLRRGRYETALLRTARHGERSSPMPRTSPATWFAPTSASADFEEANRIMESIARIPLAPRLGRLSFNALTNYQTALDAMKWGQDRQAEGLLGTLLTLKGQLLPEVYQLIARTKFKYDEPRILTLAQRGDTVGAADIAIRVYDYAIEESMIAQARKAFRTSSHRSPSNPPSSGTSTASISPSTTFPPTSSAPSSAANTTSASATSAPSPSMSASIRLPSTEPAKNLLIRSATIGPSTVDIYESDDHVVDMRIRSGPIIPSRPSSSPSTSNSPNCPRASASDATTPKLGVVYFDLIQHISIDEFLQHGPHSVPARLDEGPLC